MSESLAPMSIWMRLLRLLPLVGKVYAVTCKHEALTAAIRRSVCNFQYEYAVYQDESAQAHKIFKNSLIEFQQQVHIEDKECRELEKLLHMDFRNFYAYVNNNLALLCRKAAKDIKLYFQTTRICDSGNCRVGIYMFDESDNLVNVVYESESKKTDNYTIFKNVVENGKPYLNNNIPKSFKTNTLYVDASINKERAFEYSNGFIDTDRLTFSRLRRKDEVRECRKWTSCCVDGGQNVPLCKSHIAVPITFKGHVESGNLLDSVKQTKVKALGPSILDSSYHTIWGVIVVDYPETYFFDNTDPKHSEFGNTDINVLYQFADMLSLMMLVNRNYYFTSESVDEYMNDFRKEFNCAVDIENM